MSTSFARPTMEDFWQCCACGREVQYNFWGDSCPDCSHTRCEYCAWYTRPVRRSAALQATIGGTQAYRVSASQQSVGGMQDTDPPSVAGWWRCCQCNREIDPDFHGERCPDCGYDKCANCGMWA